MANDLSPPSQQLVTVFGGSGFVGRHVVRALVKRGYRVRVAVRRPDLAGFLQPLGTVGQIHGVQANLRYPDSVAAAIKGADAVVNLVGILQESGRQSFAGVHANGARAVAQACAALGVPRLVQISAIGASKDSKSSYGRSKAEGEAAVLALVPGAVVLRPSIMFGPEDGFFNRFAALARMLPVLPLVGGGETKFQPAFVGDVAEAIALAVDGAVAGGRIYELGGPEVKSFRELVAYICEVTGRKRLLVSLPFPLARLQARIIEIVDMLTLGLLPNELKLTRDQVALLESDNVVSHAAKEEGRDFAGLGIAPSSVEAVVPSYLWRFRKTGQFDAAQAG
ncbi:complex I NDUFA9 subunit family protein [Bosea vaviloviae]|uniref:3-beta hydroxysteroid dehydrogenase n=1 Tax=Bosea vaviloviae TaxID=1526658 RepID=A0A1D7UAE2_9HYPH|nr:complex I NDUFA9 subunit family protein [Bosea vaviloviae]AOO84274.1 3-beta hydroxysteroid dehydrogenase [Bosea vaviloviae]